MVLEVGARVELRWGSGRRRPRRDWGLVLEVWDGAGDGLVNSDGSGALLDLRVGVGGGNWGWMGVWCDRCG